MVTEQTGTVRVKKASLLKALRKNKERHIRDYAKAIEGFRKKAIRLLAEETKKISKGKLSLQLYLNSPIKRVEWYDNMINMYSAEVGDVITLSHSEYRQYIQDLTPEAIAAKSTNSFYSNSRSK